MRSINVRYLLTYLLTGQTRGWIFTHDSSKDVKSRKNVPSKKNWDPAYIFAATEASKFKFAIQLGLGQ